MALTNRDQALMWVLASLLVAAGAWFAWLTPTAQGIGQSLSAVQQLDQEKQLLTSRIAFLDATARDLTARADDRRLVELAAPADGGIDELVATFDAMATSSGVVLASLQPQSGTLVDNQLLLSLNVSGTFGAIQAFVKALERSERPLQLHTLALSSGSSFEGSTLVTATLTVGALTGPAATPPAVGGIQ